MPDCTWHFRSESYVAGGQVVFAWRWRVVRSDGAAEYSEAGFGTLDACIRDARRRGFDGEVDAASGAFAMDGYAITVSAPRL
jgi:hypothetical protein